MDTQSTFSPSSPTQTQTNPYILTAGTAIATILVLVLGLYVAYNTGMFEGVEEYLAVWWMKGKAKAEEERLKSLGKVEGVDFTKAELPGNKQAEAVTKNGLDNVGGLDSVGGIGKGIGGLL